LFYERGFGGQPFARRLGEAVILEIAKRDQLDIISGDAVMLRLGGAFRTELWMRSCTAPRGEADDGERANRRLKNTG